METDKQTLDSLLQRWHTRLKRSQLAHRFAAKGYSSFHILLGVSTIALATSTGTSLFMSLEKGLTGHGKIIMGMLSITAALLTALQTFLRLDERASKHQKADASYGTIRQKIEQNQVIREGLLENQDDFLNNMRFEMETLAKESPIVSERYWRKARAIMVQEQRNNKE